MATVVEFRQRLGWSQTELARQARLSANTVRKAENGDPVSGQTALAIANSFARALGERVLVEDIEGLNVVL